MSVELFLCLSEEANDRLEQLAKERRTTPDALIERAIMATPTRAEKRAVARAQADAAQREVEPRFKRSMTQERKR